MPLYRDLKFRNGSLMRSLASSKAEAFQIDDDVREGRSESWVFLPARDNELDELRRADRGEW